MEFPMSKYMDFYAMHEPGIKTAIVEIRSKSSTSVLGYIRWFRNWRGFAFYPVSYAETIWSVSCLQEIIECIRIVSEEHAKTNPKRNRKVATKVSQRSSRRIA